MPDEQLNIFISYSRTDAEFVDRLEADLRARGFETWVDRRRLEGGQFWKQEIDDAVAGCNLFLLTLSPAAVNSPSIRHEFERAEQLGKRIIPILYLNCTFPAWLAAADKIQRQDFTNTDAYPLNLMRLLYAIQDPALDLGAPTDMLYNQALQLRTLDPERAAIILQHIVDREPMYFGGQAQRDLADLKTHLYAARVAHLRVQAEQARRQGQYGVEAASLEALLALGDRDPTTITWAKKYLRIAQQNRMLLGPYGVIQQRAADGDIATARALMQSLWSQAPYFHDPANIAPLLGLAVPPTYDQAQSIAAEQQRWERTCALLSGDLSNTSLESVRAELRQYTYDLVNLDATAVVERIIALWQLNASLLSEAKRWQWQSGEFKLTGYDGTVVVLLCFVGLFAVANNGFWGFALIAAAVVYGVAAKRRTARRVHRILRDADSAREQAREQYQRWHRLAGNVYQQRLDAII